MTSDEYNFRSLKPKGDHDGVQVILCYQIINFFHRHIIFLRKCIYNDFSMTIHSQLIHVSVSIIAYRMSFLIESLVSRYNKFTFLSLFFFLCPLPPLSLPFLAREETICIINFLGTHYICIKRCTPSSLKCIPTIEN